MARDEIEEHRVRVVLSNVAKEVFGEIALELISLESTKLSPTS